MVGVPDGAVQRQKPVHRIINGEVAEISGRAGRTDDAANAGHASGVTAAAGEVEVGDIVAAALGDVGQIDRLVVKRAAEGAVEDDASGDVVAEMVKPTIEGARRIGADLELAVVEVHRLGGIIHAKGAAGTHAHGAGVDSDGLAEAVLGVLKPEGRILEDVRLDQAVGRKLHTADLAREDPVAGAEEDLRVASVEERVARDEGVADGGVSAALAGGHADGQAAREDVVSDARDAARAVDRSRTTGRDRDLGSDGEARTGRGTGDDETSAGVTRAARAGPAEDGHHVDRAELRGIRHHQRTTTDGDRVADIVGGAGQHERAVAGLRDATLGDEAEIQDRGRAEIDGDIGHDGRRGPGQGELVRSRGGEIKTIAQAREDESAESDVPAEFDRPAEAREISRIIRRESGGGGDGIAGGGGEITRVEPVGGRGIPDTGAPESGGVAVSIPEIVRGLGGLGRADGEKRRGDHQRGARKQGTRLRTFH